MKKLLITLLLFASFSAFAQLPGLKKMVVVSTDTIYINDQAYSVRLEKTTRDEYHYYMLESEDPTRLRKTLRSRVSKFVEKPKINESISVLEDSVLIGKELLIQVSPFMPPLSRYWQVLIDDGVNGNYVLSSQKGVRVKFTSEMAIINYLIGRDWKLDLIQNVQTGEVGGATGFLGGIFGGKVTLSKNVYFYKALYTGK